MSLIADLVRESPVLEPGASVAAAAEIFLDPVCSPFLSLPVVDGITPVGVLTRHALQNIYMSRFGRDLHGRKKVADLMTANPIVVEASSTVEQASPEITRRIGFPIREDFVVTREGAFVGVGVVVDLLKAMETQVAHRNKELAAALHRLKESQSHLVQSEKMASLGQMVAGVAHEMNTPLGYVRNNVEMIAALTGAMRSPDISADELQQLLDDTLHGVDQLGELVSGLKDFSRMDRAATENININDCVSSALLIARNVLKDKVDVVRDDGKLPPVSCVPSKINQVLLNLFTNAAQAMAGRGRLLVRTRHEGDFVTISVQDNGSGIPAGILPRIFDPFFTTKPVGQGTGLGLSICYRILQEHGGDIRVASVPGRGTRFLVSLPLAESVARKSIRETAA